MNKNSETYQLIDDYLLGRLSDEALARIKERIASDEEFAEQVRIHQAVIDGLTDHASEELRSELNKSPVKEKKVPVSSFSRIKKLGYAAVLLALFGVAGYFYLTRSTLNEKLYEEYFSSYPNRLTEGLRGSQPYFTGLSEENMAGITKGLEAYENKDYQGVIHNLERKPELLNEYPALKFYLALSHSQSGNPEKAIRYLKELDKGQKDFYIEVLPWYLALSYLQNNQPEMAKSQLKVIIEKGYMFDENAQEIMQMLEGRD